MRKTKITVAVITKNEEKNIKACIESVKGWADEVIVVDGYSEDQTVSIAESLGAKAIRHHFEGDFSKERNIANDNAIGEWVLHIDADDRVTKDFKTIVDDIIDKSEGINAYKFRRKSFFLGHFMRYGGWYHSVPNFVRKSRVRFEGQIHERPVYPGELGVLDADIEHYPFESIAQFMDRHNRYSSIQAEKMFRESGTAKLKHIKRTAIMKTFKTFWKMYVKKQGYKEGMHGFVFASLFALTNFLTWLKYWEKCAAGKK